MAKKKIQKLSIRLLKENIEPSDALREGIELQDWPKLEGAKIALDTMGGNSPKWANFLELSEEEKNKVRNSTAYGLIFLQASGRWFAISFGMGHVKLDPSKFERDFGLRVVLNSVDAKQLKSADLRTPDENTLVRRSQTSRGSDQTAFGIDIERDIIRGLAGTPKDESFAKRVAGSDALSMDRKLKVDELPQVCQEALNMYKKDDYRENFGWVDQVRHIRDEELIETLNEAAAKKIDAVLKGDDPDGIHLAFPIIYDPEKTSFICHKGFRSKSIFPSLDIKYYIEDLRERGINEYDVEYMKKHTIHEVDEDRKDCGNKWKISECLVLEVEHDGHIYVLSGGMWFQVDKDYADELQEFFNDLPKETLPHALPDETEAAYNDRIKNSNPDIICLDRKLIKPKGWATPIEICDFLSKDGKIIHIKSKSQSSRLSHLFNQGTVSGQILVIDGEARDMIREIISEVQKEMNRSGFEGVIPPAGENFSPQDFTVVYAVIVPSENPRLPFFSLVTLRQAVRELRALGYKVAFAWIITSPGDMDFEEDTEGDAA